MSQEKSFWKSAPGTVAAVAAMVTALAGAVPVIMAVRGDDKPAGTTTPTATAEPSPGSSSSPNGSEPFGTEGEPGGSGIAPPVIASPGSIDFGKVAPALSAPTQDLQIVNNGDEPVTIERIRIVGPAASSFTVSETTCAEGAELAADATCDVKVRFAPSGSGTMQATLVVDRSPGDPVQVPLSGSTGLL